MYKIIIVDDHSLFREGIKLLIENEGVGQVIAEAENGQVFLDLLENHTPDLIIMDIEMPIMGGLEAIQKALKVRPELKFLVLTMLNEKNRYSDIIYAGAMGFVLKTSGKKEFEKAINVIVNGESYFSPEMLRQMLMSSRDTITSEILDKQQTKFSDREQQVLSLLCKGLSVSEVADAICLSAKTVEVHRAKLLKKTNTKNTINLVLYALKNKLVEFDV